MRPLSTRGHSGDAIEQRTVYYIIAELHRRWKYWCLTAWIISITGWEQWKHRRTETENSQSTANWRRAERALSQTNIWRFLNGANITMTFTTATNPWVGRDGHTSDWTDRSVLSDECADAMRLMEDRSSINIWYYRMRGRVMSQSVGERRDKQMSDCLR